MKNKNNKLASNMKAEAARVRKIATAADQKERELKSKEDQYWQEASGAKSRAAKKREEEAEKRAEAAAKKAEARRLAELEEKELARIVKKPDTVKVTEAELLRKKEEEKVAIRRKLEEERKRTTRVVDKNEYERMVNVSNLNRGVEKIEASTVEDAIVQLADAGSISCLHMTNSEKKHKAFFMAFQEAEMPLLREEKPGLTQNQYKDMVWKMWKKSMDNPENQVRNVSKLSVGPVVPERKDVYMMKVEVEAVVGGVMSDESDQESVDDDEEEDEFQPRLEVTLADYLFCRK